MSQGPVIVRGPAGALRYVDPQPDVYSLCEKWDALNALWKLPQAYRRDCQCQDERHDYYCPDPEASRPESIAAARIALASFQPEWQQVLDILEADPNAFIVVR